MEKKQNNRIGAFFLLALAVGGYFMAGLGIGVYICAGGSALLFIIDALKSKKK